MLAAADDIDRLSFVGIFLGRAPTGDSSKAAKSSVSFGECSYTFITLAVESVNQLGGAHNDNLLRENVVMKSL